MQPKFEKGEKVLTFFHNQEGVILEIVENHDSWKEKYQYLVEIEDNKFNWFGLRKNTKKREWLLERMLCKFI